MIASLLIFLSIIFGLFVDRFVFKLAAVCNSPYQHTKIFTSKQEQRALLALDYNLQSVSSIHKVLVKGFQVQVRSGEKVLTGEKVTSHVKWWSLVHLKPNIKILTSSHVLLVQKSRACHTSMFFF